MWGQVAGKRCGVAVDAERDGMKHYDSMDLLKFFFGLYGGADSCESFSCVCVCLYRPSSPDGRAVLLLDFLVFLF